MADAAASRAAAGLALIGRRLAERNATSQAFFTREAHRLAVLSRLMSARFARGGRLLAFGHGSAATDAQHVAVEFAHPVLVGKRALPAVDLSADYQALVPALAGPDDIVIGFGGAGADPSIAATLERAAARGALVIALPGSRGDYATPIASPDPFIHQEMMEVLYHTLWETVHVFFEQQRVGHDDGGAATFLYPFLSDDVAPEAGVIAEVAASIRAKAACDEGLRDRVVAEGAQAMLDAAVAVHGRVAAGATVLCFGNGGSATDATDLALDLVAGPKGYRPVPALSLAADAATLTAVANDVGASAIFVRQLAAYARPGDVVVAISTSGGSANVIAALEDARKRGLLTVALLGYDGGEILRRGLADHAIVVPNDQIPRVQEVQASIYHVLVDLLDALSRGR